MQNNDDHKLKPKDKGEKEMTSSFRMPKKYWERLDMGKPLYLHVYVYRADEPSQSEVTSHLQSQLFGKDDTRNNNRISIQKGNAKVVHGGDPSFLHDVIE